MNTYDYEFINTYNGRRSPDGTVEKDMSTFYFFRCLYQRALSIVDFTLPDGWNKNYFKNVLFSMGYIGIIPTPDYGIIPQICNVSGYGLYLQPTKVLVAQPLVNFEGTRGRDCEIVRLTPDYQGICDIVEHYAIQLAKLQTSINVSIINSRLGLIAAAKNKSGAETLKQVAEKLSAGEPLIVIDKLLKEDAIDNNGALFMQTFNVKDSYITDKLLQDYETILTNFDREIGIPTIGNKKERRIEKEVDTMVSDFCTRRDTWKTALTESTAEVRELFPQIDIKFTFRGEEEEENVTYSEDNSDRAV